MQAAFKAVLYENKWWIANLLGGQHVLERLSVYFGKKSMWAAASRVLLLVPEIVWSK